METGVYIVIALVVVVFVFLLGVLGRARDGEAVTPEAERLAAELEVERRRVAELQTELDRLRSLERSGA